MSSFLKSSKRILILSLTIVIVSISAYSSDLDLGIRYLKLSSSYRDLGKLDKSREYLEKSDKYIRSTSSKYWNGSLNESWGMYYKFIGKSDSSIYYFKEAKKCYDKVLKDKDGSRLTIDLMIASEFKDNPNSGLKANENKPDPIKESEPKIVKSKKKVRQEPKTSPIDDKNLSELESKVKGLEKEISDLKLTNSILKKSYDESQNLLYRTRDTLKQIKIENKSLKDKVSTGAISKPDKVPQVIPAPEPPKQEIKPVIKGDVVTPNPVIVPKPNIEKPMPNLNNIQIMVKDSIKTEISDSLKKLDFKAKILELRKKRKQGKDSTDTNSQGK